MSEDQKAELGTIAWRDLTVDDADGVREFYEKVAGWVSEPVDMGGYQDFSMKAGPDGEVVAGICHARGSNAKIPPQWLVYILVEDVEAKAAQCRELGGSVLDGPRSMGAAKFCVIQDPAGAICGLYQPAPK